MIKLLKQEIIGVVLGLTPWIIMGIFLLPRITFGSENLRILEAMPIGRDQAHVAGVMWGGWKTGAPMFYSTYGYLYYNISWWILKIISLFIPITEQLIIIVLRSLSLFSFLGIGFFSYFWVRKRLSVVYALFYSLLFLALFQNNDFILRTTVVQPDMINMFAIIIAFFTSVDLALIYNRNRIIYSAISVGAVMSIKYIGFIFLPIIVFIIYLHKKRLKVIIRSTALYFFIFLLTFGVFSSHSLYQFEFVKKLLLVENAFIHYKGGPLMWLKFIYYDVLGMLLSFLFIIGIIFGFFKNIRIPKIKINCYRIIGLIWAWYSILFLLIFSQSVVHRYIYPALPAIILVITFAMINIAAFWNKKVLFISIVLITLLLNSVNLSIKEYFNSKNNYSCLECMPGIQVGRWLDKNIKTETKILWDEYEYIPYKFSNNLLLPSGDPKLHYKKFVPDIIIIQGSYIRYIHSLDNEDYDEIYYEKAKVVKKFYEELVQNRLPYQQIAVFGSEGTNNDILIFEKN